MTASRDDHRIARDVLNLALEGRSVAECRPEVSFTRLQ